MILIILGKQHQHTFRNYKHILLSLSLHFYSFYLLLDSTSLNMKHIKVPYVIDRAVTAFKTETETAVFAKNDGKRFRTR